MKGFFGHLKTVSRHRRAVFLHCKKAGIAWQGLTHDLSKFSPAEFFQGIKYYQGYRSPNDRERELFGHSPTWMHHKGRNRHHFEYWTDYHIKTKQIVPIKMPLRYVAEMFCDRLAASKIYNGKKYTQNHPLDYFLSAKEVRLIHPETSDLLEHWLRVLAEQGEEQAFALIRETLKQEKSKNQKSR
jgi:hypothetical protein